MDALNTIRQNAIAQNVTWSGQARKVLEQYHELTCCYTCKHGILRTSAGLDSGGKMDLYITQYCRLLSMDVYDNTDDSELISVIQTCDGYDDTPDDDE